MKGSEVRKLNQEQQNVFYAQHRGCAIRTRMFKGRWRYRHLTGIKTDYDEIEQLTKSLKIDREWSNGAFPFIYFNDTELFHLITDLENDVYIERVVTPAKAVAIDSKWKLNFKCRFIWDYDNAQTVEEVREKLWSCGYQIVTALRSWSAQHANDDTVIALAVLGKDKFTEMKMVLALDPTQSESI